MGKAFVDACVLLDIFNEDERFCEWSIQSLNEFLKTHELVINTIIFSEISLNFESCDLLVEILSKLNIGILDIPLPVAFKVSRTFKQYKRNKGEKRSAMPDFYFGAHATFLGAPIITRDTARYKTYFPDLTLITPE